MTAMRKDPAAQKRFSRAKSKIHLDELKQMVTIQYQIKKPGKPSLRNIHEQREKLYRVGDHGQKIRDQKYKSKINL